MELDIVKLSHGVMLCTCWVAQLGRVSYYCGNIVTYNNAYESTTCV